MYQMNKLLKGLGITFLAIVSLGVLAVLFLGVFRAGAMPMMAYGWRGSHMAGVRGIWGGLWMAGRILLPGLFIALMVLVGVAIGRSGHQDHLQQTSVSPSIPPAPAAAVVDDMSSIPAAGPAPQPASSPAPQKCAHCGAELQEGWVNCPYCGLKIR